MMKNAFYFTFKLTSFSRFLNLFLTFWLFRETAKFVTSKPGKQTIALYIMSDISRSKGNQPINFGQLIEYDMGSIFLDKIMHKMW